MALDDNKSITKVRDCAVGLLARREHSTHELQQKLLHKQFPATDIDQVLSDLSARNLLSDVRFTEMYARQRARKGYGPLRISMELRARGVSDDVIDEQLFSMADVWQASLQMIANKKFKSKPASNLEAAKQKYFLQQRGFTHDQIKVFFQKHNN